MARRGENIYKRKDGRWEGRYKNGIKEDGKPRYSSIYGPTYSDVRKKLIKKRAEQTSETLKCNFTFGELSELWLEYIRHNIKESTYANYYLKLKKHILPYFSNIKYEKMNIKIMNDFIDKKLSSGLSAKYVSDIGRVIRAVTKFAFSEFGYSDKARLLNLPKPQNVSCKTLNPTQQRLLISHLFKNPCFNDLGIVIASVTGIRVGELCALKWEDIDLEKRIISISKTMQRIKNINSGPATKIVVTDPKSKTSLRDIPIPDILYKLLKPLYKRKDCYVLTNKESFIEPRLMQYRFRSLLKRLQLPQINFHALRHMFATRCISIGIDVKTLSEILGHHSVEVTLNRYVHSSMDRKKLCMKHFSARLLQSVEI